MTIAGCLPACCRVYPSALSALTEAVATPLSAAGHPPAPSVLELPTRTHAGGSPVDGLDNDDDDDGNGGSGGRGPQQDATPTRAPARPSGGC